MEKFNKTFAQKNAVLILFVILISIMMPALSGCGQSGSFEHWNKDAASLKELTDYVSTVTKKGGEHFIPVEDRIAVFDLDGTLYGELAPTYFDWCTYAYRVLDDPDFKDKATSEMIKTAQTIRNIPNDGIPDWLEEAHIKNNAEAFAGMTIEAFQNYIRDYAQREVPGLNNLKYADMFYKPMQDVISYLEANDFKVFVVSGTDTWVCRTLAEGKLDLPYDQIIGAIYNVMADHQGEKYGLEYTMSKDDQIIRDGTYTLKNVKTFKINSITERIGKQPVLSFGNSTGDFSMATYATANNQYLSKAFFNIADDSEREFGNEEKAAAFKEKVTANGWVPISMKNDWLTIYGENVTKK